MVHNFIELYECLFLLSNWTSDKIIGENYVQSKQIYKNLDSWSSLSEFLKHTLTWSSAVGMHGPGDIALSTILPIRAQIWYE